MMTSEFLRAFLAAVAAFWLVLLSLPGRNAPSADASSMAAPFAHLAGRLASN